MDVTTNRSSALKMASIPKTVWLWLSLASFSILICITLVDMFFLYPHAHPYFEKSGTLADKQLSARARNYLYKSLEAVSTLPFDEPSRNKAQLNLDLAYSSLSIHFYIKQYPCTSPSLKKIDILAQQLNTQNLPNTNFFTHTLVSVLQCAEFIQSQQDAKRTDSALKMLEELSLQSKLLFWGTIILLTASLIFALMYMRHSKIISQNRQETHEWIRHAMQDSLTGIPNRRAFDKDLPRYADSYVKYGHSFSLLMCDIDYFKQYNDTLGHIEGDKALQLIAQTLSDNLKESDKLYRYGGEEIAIIIPNTSDDEAHQIGLSLISRFHDLKLPHPTSEFGFITISIGCANSNEITGDGYNLVQLADKRLYSAKQNGRNRLISKNSSTNATPSLRCAL